MDFAGEFPSEADLNESIFACEGINSWSDNDGVDTYVT